MSRTVKLPAVMTRRRPSTTDPSCMGSEVFTTRSPPKPMVWRKKVRERYSCGVSPPVFCSSKFWIEPPRPCRPESGRSAITSGTK
jgi:hypothetical protein